MDAQGSVQINVITPPPTWRKAAAIAVALGYFNPRLIHLGFNAQDGFGAYLYDFATRVGYPLFSLWLLRRWAGIEWRQIGIPGTVWGDYTKGEFFSYAFICTLCWMTQILFAVVLYTTWPDLDSGQLLHLSTLGPMPIAVGVYLLLVGPVTEEIFCRGVLSALLLGNRNSFLAKTAYVIASALLFGAGHSSMGLFGMLQTAYLGAVAAMLFLWVRNIWIVVFAHFVYDFIVMVFYVLPAG